MTNSKMIGGVLIAAGSGLLVWGYKLYGALGNQFSRALGGASSSETMIVLIAGGVCAVLGVVALARK
jgi:hypothetical protein